MTTTGTSSPRVEKLLADFEPSFDFVGAPQLPESEYADRITRIRRDATVAGHDAVLVHSSLVGWYHTSNPFLRYICDWAREGVLIIPTDAAVAPQLVSFWTESALLPPVGEPLLVEDIWQVPPWGRENVDRPGSSLTEDRRSRRRNPRQARPRPRSARAHRRRHGHVVLGRSA